MIGGEEEREREKESGGDGNGQSEELQGFRPRSTRRHASEFSCSFNHASLHTKQKKECVSVIVFW